MEKILSKKSKLLCGFKKRKIISEINDFFDKVHLYKNDQEICFSTDNYFALPSDTSDKYSSLSDWEWGTNEIYLQKSIVDKELKASLTIALETVEELLVKNFAGTSFFIIASLQHGKYRNINIRICINRENPYMDSEIERYNQPVLREILIT